MIPRKQTKIQRKYEKQALDVLDTKAESDVFNEGMDSSGYREILLNCLKNLGVKVMELYEKRNENKKCIKGTC